MGTYTYKDSAQGAIYHLYNRGNNKKNIFLETPDYTFYISRLQAYAKQHNFSVVAFCLMPNHVHLLVKQNSTLNPQKLMASLHTSYSKFFNKKYAQVGHLFQGRYKQKIINSDEYISYLAGYIHLNPVKANLCVKPQDYPWSSYKEFLGIGTTLPMCDQKLIKELDLSIHLDSPSLLMTLFTKITPKEAFDDPED